MAATKEDKVEAQREESAQLAANSATLTEAQAAAENQLRDRIRAEERAKLTNEVTGESVEGFGGQVKASKNFTVLALEDDIQRQLVEIKFAAQVGPGLRIPASRVKELSGLLSELTLPDQEK